MSTFGAGDGFLQRTSDEALGRAPTVNFGAMHAVPVPVTVGIPKNAPVLVEVSGRSIQLIAAFVSTSYSAAGFAPGTVYVRLDSPNAQRFPLFPGIPRYAPFQRLYIDTNGAYSVAGAKLILEIGAELTMPCLGNPSAPLVVRAESCDRYFGYQYTLTTGAPRTSFGHAGRLVACHVTNRGPDPVVLALTGLSTTPTDDKGIYLPPLGQPFTFASWLNLAWLSLPAGGGQGSAVVDVVLLVRLITGEELNV